MAGHPVRGQQERGEARENRLAGKAGAWSGWPHYLEMRSLLSGNQAKKPDKKMKKTVLMVSYAFPPSSEAGSLRSLRFVKYLPGFGWEPVVLTAAAGVHGRLDEALIKEVPATIRVVRARTLETLVEVIKRGSSDNNPARHHSVDPAPNNSGTAFRRLARWAYWRADAWFMIPDQRIGWIPSAIRQGMSIIRNQPVQAIYSSGSPWSAHIIAAVLKKISGLPWLADYRDFWTLRRDPNLKLPRHRLLLEEWLEHALMRFSDLNVFVNEQTRRGYLAKYADLSPGRVRTLSNGFDPSDFAHPGGNGHSTGLEIFHAGTASTPQYALEPFFKAIRSWIDAHPEARPELRLRFIGELGANERFIRHYGLEEVVSNEGPIPHREVTRLMQGAAVLLVVLGGHPPETRAMKTLEYLKAGRPIWAVAVEGATTELVHASGCGWTSLPWDEAGIRQTLDEIWQAYRAGSLAGLRPDPAVVAQFDGRRLTGQLAGWLDELAAPKGQQAVEKPAFLSF